MPIIKDSAAHTKIAIGQIISISDVPKNSIGHLKSNSSFRAWKDNIPVTYPPVPKKAACPKEINPQYPRARFKPMPAIASMITLVVNVI